MQYFDIFSALQILPTLSGCKGLSFFLNHQIYFAIFLIFFQPTQILFSIGLQRSILFFKPPNLFCNIFKIAYFCKNTGSIIINALIIKFVVVGCFCFRSGNAEISGIPDYIIAKRSPYGRVLDIPFLVMIEAKKDDFDEGWGQCLAQMITAQSLNKDTDKIYGVVTNGNLWQFGQLEAHTFTKHSASYSLEDLNKLYNVLYYLFELCEKRVDSIAN